jgi:WD40 repeat protein
MRSIILSVCVLLAMTSRGQYEVILPLGHQASVTETEFSGDDRFILTASEDHTLKVWESNTGRLLYTMSGFQGAVTAFCQSHDGNLVAAGDERGNVSIWDFRNARQIAKYHPHSSRIESMFFSSNNEHVASLSLDSSFAIWNWKAKQMLDSIHFNARYARMKISPGNNEIVLATNAGLLLRYDFVKGSILNRFQSQLKDEFLDVCFIKHGHEIATVAPFPSRIQIFETEGLKPIRNFTLDKTEDAGGVAWRIVPSRGDTLAVLRLKTASIEWFTTDGRRVREIREPDGQDFKQFIFSNKKDRFFTLSDKLLVWDFLNKSPVIKTESISAKTIALSHAEDWVAESSGISGQPDVYSLKKDGELFELSGQAHVQTDFVFAPGGSTMLTLNNNISHWNLSNGQLEQVSLFREGTTLFQLRNSGDSSRFLVTSRNGNDDANAYLFDHRTGHMLREWKDVDPWSMALNNKGDKILGSFETGVELRDIATDKVLTHIEDPVTSLALNGTATRAITSSNKGVLVLWQMPEGRMLKTWPLQEMFGRETAGFSAPKQPEFSGDEKYISTILENHKTLVVINAVNYDTLFSFEHPWEATSFFSPDNRFIATISGGSLRVFDLTKPGFFQETNFDEELFGLTYKSDGSALIVAGDRHAFIYDVESHHVDSLSGFGSRLTFGAFTPDQKHIVTASHDHLLKYWDLGSRKLVYSFAGIGDAEYFAQLPSGYYQATPGAVTKLHYLAPGPKRVSFEQMDVVYNRPDLFLEALGSPDTALISAYRRAYEKRMRRLGIDTASARKKLSVPAAELVNREQISLSQNSKSLSLHILASDSLQELDRLNTWVNETPVWGLKGILLRGRGLHRLDTTVNINLSAGTNIIEISATNKAGLESYRMPLTVSAKLIATGKIFFIGIGIDSFHNSKYNLKYSVKDIRDLVKLFKAKYGANIHIDTLFNSSVTTNRVLALKRSLLGSHENDKVILAYSGHGLLSKELDYFLSGFGVDFQNPENGGIAYETLESLLDSIPARQKLLLLDACHSGEVDKEDVLAIGAIPAGGSSGLAKGIIPGDRKQAPMGLRSSFELMQLLFANVSRSTGATVIAAAAGTQFAIERGDLKNGIFTYALLEFLRQAKNASVRDLKNYVNYRVPELAGGTQVPTLRRENRSLDWKIW